MKVFNLIFCLLFVFSAALQFNDPDPYLWVTIYLYGALLCFRAFRGYYNIGTLLGGVVVYLAWAIFLFFTNEGVWDWITKHNAEDIAATMKAEKPWIEVAREFFGLVILITVLLINFFYARKRSHRFQ